MKIFEHFKCYCSFWKPSLARRISLYFLLFGLIIFLVTSMLYMVGAKKQFIGSTSKLINDQLSQLDGSNEPDFIWKGINKPQPQLYRLLRILTNLFLQVFILFPIFPSTAKCRIALPGIDWIFPMARCFSQIEFQKTLTRINLIVGLSIVFDRQKQRFILITDPIPCS